MRLTVGARRDEENQIVSTLMQDDVEVLASRNPFVIQDRYKELKAQPRQRAPRAPSAQKSRVRPENMMEHALAHACRVHIGMEVCDANVDFARELYREIKGADLDESRTRERGYYRYPAGPRNADPATERVYGCRVEWRVRCYEVDGDVVRYNSKVLALALLRDGYDLGYNDVRGDGDGR